MIVHIVLFRPKAGLDMAARSDLAGAFRAALRDIGSIRRGRIGRRRTHGRPYEHLMQEDYTHAAIVEFDDMTGLKAYLNDPVHEALGAQFFACFEKALIYDFEMTEGDRALEALVFDDIT